MTRKSRVPRRLSLGLAHGATVWQRGVTARWLNFPMELGDLECAVDCLVRSDPSSCADAESIESLQRQLARLEAFVTAATAAFDASGEWASDGARNASAWLSVRCRLPRGHTRRLVRRGRALRQLPICAEAWSNGDINGAHVDILAALRRPVTEDALARDEEMLVGQAGTLRFDAFTERPPTGSSWRIPTGSRGASKRAGTGGTCTWRAVSAACGWERSPSTRSPGLLSPVSWGASSARCSKLTGRRHGRPSVVNPLPARCHEPRASAAPMPSSKWPLALGPHPPTDVGRHRFSASWWATKRSMVGSASSSRGR